LLDSLEKLFIMSTDKSLFFYGSIYHRLLDPQIAEARQVTIDFINEKSSVLDIACGTGQLCFALREQKQCQVVGLDLSLRMLEFARKCDPFQNISFIHGDATNLETFSDRSFDYATMLMLMHELPGPQQVCVLKEAMRVASKGIIIDAVTPLPKNAGGIGIRIIERTFGHDHNPNFKSFINTGGIRRILEESGLPVKVEHSSVFWHNCREIIVVSTK
jgi:ubiquinone/menaquinone biosynthesis C-methylase UbiE